MEKGSNFNIKQFEQIRHMNRLFHNFMSHKNLHRIGTDSLAVLGFDVIYQNICLLFIVFDTAQNRLLDNVASNTFYLLTSLMVNK